MKPRHYLIIVHPSGGYLYPYIAIGQMLQRHYQKVSFIGDDQMGGLFELNGLPFYPVSNNLSEHPFLHIGSWYDPQTNVEQINVFQQLIPIIQPDVLVSSPLSISTMICAESFHLPRIIIGFATFLYPGLGGQDLDKFWRIKDMTNYLNKVLEQFGQAPKSMEQAQPLFLGDLFFQRSIPELEVPLPTSVHFSGLAWYNSPFYKNVLLEQFIEKQIQLGKTVVYLQIGRLFDSRQHWQLFLENFANVPYCFVADIGRADYLDASISVPDNFFLHSFIPISAIKDVVKVVVTTGQSTSFLGAIYYQLPNIVLPYSEDGKEIGSKVEKMGIGKVIRATTELQPHSFSQMLQEAINDVEISKKLLLYKQKYLAIANETTLIESFKKVATSKKMVHI